MTPDKIPTELTRRAYALRGVTVSQNQYAAVVADAWEDVLRLARREYAEHGGRLLVASGDVFDVEETTLIDRQEGSLLYEVWVKRGEGNGES